ncbi:MAG: outer membrane protein assembly factor BamD [Deltaproteobacteria bacterium]|nr:MAG: outer membrane protein assembly factor BamD [Deltaproteobacteria bacterium]
MRSLQKTAVAFLLLCGGLGGGAAGCVTTAEQGRRMQAQLDAHESRLADLEARLQAQETRLSRAMDRLDAKITEVNQALEKLGLAARKNDAEFGVTVDRMLQELQEVRGGLEQLRYELDRQAKAQATFEEATKRRLAELGGKESLAQYEAEQKAKAEPEATDPAEVLARARRHQAQGEHALARKLYQSIIDRWPDSPQAAEAQYGLALSWYEEGAWRPAILEFNTFREKYGKHEKVPDALLRIGDSFAKIGLEREAGTFYDAVIRNFPKTKAAGEAKKRKKGLGAK